MDTTSIILAIGTPPGRSARGLLRIDGPGTGSLLETMLDRPAEHGDGASRARLDLAAGSLPVLALRFGPGRSYTGNEAAELQMPGNPELLDRVLAELLQRGAAAGLDVRRAEPGEYTARAFVNGRMPLTEAEGVAATIAARSDAALRAARMLTGGGLERLARDLGDEVAELLALVEAGIDFTDQEDVVAIAPAALAKRLTSARDRLADHLRRSVGLERLQSVPSVVLTGLPNAGKSTLFNALLGRRRAVVADVPGTTRDVLAEPMVIEGATGAAEVMLIDIAGADDPRTPLEAMMQRSAADAVARAELVLQCVPCDAPRPDADRDTLLVRTKADLADVGASDDASRDGAATDAGAIVVSAHRQRGLNRLREAIAARVADRAVSLAADALALQPRHDAALRSAAADLDDAMRLVGEDVGRRDLAAPELVASSLRAALDQLGSLAGDLTPDDVLGRIFATFCVGK